MIKLIGFQYRKRYGLHAMERRMIMKDYTKVSIPQAVRIACNAARQNELFWLGAGFNTASGTDCMQSAVAFEDKIDLSIVSIPQAVRIACNQRRNSFCTSLCDGFNTASGTDCMQ